MSAGDQNKLSRLRTVVVAVDASDNAMAALNWYLNELHRAGDYVVLCHVPEQPDLPTFKLKHGISLPFDDWKKAVQERNETITKLETNITQTIGTRLSTQSYKFSVPQTNSKSPGQAIISTAESDGARMIVVGTRGLDVVRRTLLGSVSEYVVRHSRVPVVVCPYSAPAANN
jgi:nucleotide-binding universal stress UspA family protein